MRFFAPAKINLALEILGKRPDGYHNLDTIMQTVGLYDIIDIEKNSDNTINIGCNKDLNCSLKENIIYKSIVSFFNFTKIKNKGLNINVQKNIPICAGLGGGSTDGAAVLIGLDKIFKTNLKSKELLNIASKIGCDVPFCLFGGTFRATETGIKLEKLKNIPSCYFILVKPNLKIITKNAYEKFEFYNKNYNFDIKKILLGIEKKDSLEISKNLFNRFEDLLENKDKNIISSIKELILKYGALNSSMTGSGPSVFGMFKNLNLAKNCLGNIKKIYGESFLCESLCFSYLIKK
ncbi:MAG: 4-(cytidine 5'-diphospho)-2-C-methyl-D-erythritol kinase [Candidatus Paraimprobicoccus trichonymphae]|uniref:4-diphosphocytidyl-2-C-methyl-D-erythritol kinase n=1 Tax=Candidatus Paraimprobicoccus trichonymphae TaxID=3033793 RepID=A0AA48L038_9FIRM|nr:MAG: 4-(cytidine 5'-diphospho)-2-C-methyl-D-erythritol kinase [Candidatus Paraimprobicoccus trichonymphae]